MDQRYKVVYRNDGEDFDRDFDHPGYPSVQDAWLAVGNTLRRAGRPLYSLTKVEILPVNQPEGGPDESPG